VGSSPPLEHRRTAPTRRAFLRTCESRSVVSMAIELDHTIVHVSDRARGAAFLTDLFDLPAPRPFGHFLVVEVDNGVSLDFIETDDRFDRQHYAFLVGEDEFTRIHGRIVAEGIDHWADPGRTQPGAINHHDGGRGVYFADPDDHLYEIITRPYGSGS
jgi:catechol 2,3-dioxygenase-like lactoylglutathione lyase family enzyme